MAENSQPCVEWGLAYVARSGMKDAHTGIRRHSTKKKVEKIAKLRIFEKSERNIEKVRWIPHPHPLPLQGIPASLLSPLERRAPLGRRADLRGATGRH